MAEVLGLVVGHGPLVNHHLGHVQPPVAHPHSRSVIFDGSLDGSVDPEPGNSENLQQ